MTAQLSRSGFLELYMGMGLSLIPIKARDKRPAVESWERYQSERASPEQVGRWFLDPALNVGVVCGKASGNFVVLDFDSEEAFARYWGGKHPEEKTFTVRTSRGFQVWMRDPVLEESMTKFDFRPFMDLELRANQHYVVAPPSVHPSGAVYQVLGTFEIFEAPGLAVSVENRLKELGYLEVARKWPRLKEVVDGTALGNRNAAAFVMARYLLFSLEMEEHDAFFGLQVWNRRNKPPLSDAELERLVESARRYPKRSRQEVFKQDAKW